MPKSKEELLREENSKDSECAMDLYDEATKLGDFILDRMKVFDIKLQKGITMNQYDLITRLSLYLLRIEMFNNPKYSSKEKEILNRIWKASAIHFHTFFLMKQFKINSIYNKSLENVEKMYIEKVEFCDYAFMNSNELSLSNYLSTPATLFGFDYMTNDFLEIEEFSKKMNKSNKQEKDFYFKLYGAIVNGFLEYKKNIISFHRLIDEFLRKY